MKIINENIYAGDTNNKINKKKYKKHSQSPFTTLDAGNVEKNVEFFNHISSGEANINSSAGMNGNAVGEALLSETAKPTYTFSYKGPVYRFNKIYTVLKEPIYVTADNINHAYTLLTGKLKKQNNFSYNSNLTIDKDDIIQVTSDPFDYEVIEDNPIKKEQHKESDYIYSINNHDIYFENGYYKIDDLPIKFISEEDIRDYLEESYMNLTEKMLTEDSSTYTIFFCESDSDGNPTKFDNYHIVAESDDEALRKAIGTLVGEDEEDEAAIIDTLSTYGYSLDADGIREYLENIALTSIYGIIYGIKDSNGNLILDNNFDYYNRIYNGESPVKESLSYSQIIEKLNEIDRKCIDENLKFYDIKTLFEDISTKLTPQDKEEIKKIIQTTDDAETIAAVINSKTKKESLDEDENVDDDPFHIDLTITHMPEDFDEWDIEDIESVGYEIEDVAKYETNHDADYFVLTFNDGSKKAWYIHSGMYVEDKEFNENFELNTDSLNENIDISTYDELSSTISDNGKNYKLFRKLEDGKGKWAAAPIEMGDVKYDDAFEITYEQARGQAPLSRIGELSRELGKKLLPKNEALEDDVPYTYEQMEKELKSATNNWTKDNFEGWVGFIDEFNSAMDILSRHYENVEKMGHNYAGYGFLATRPSVYENLNEASYGGAYDIDDEMYFTKDDIVDFADLVVERLEKEFDKTYQITDLGFNDPTHLYIELEDAEGYSFDYELVIDMRKIRKPRDIYKYVDLVTDYFKNRFKLEYDFEETVPENYNESLNESASKLNNREKQVYIDALKEAEDREDLEDIVHEIFFYDRGLFVLLRHFPKDMSFEDLKGKLIEIIQSTILDENLKESLWNNYLIEFKDLDDGKIYSEEYEGYDRKEAIELFRADYPESDNYKLLHVYKLTDEGWEETYYNYDESLNEKLVDVSDDLQKEFEQLFDKNGWKIEDKGNTWMGDIHYQIISTGHPIEEKDLKNYANSLIKDIDVFSKKYDIPVTWNFGLNNEYMPTAGVDIYKQYIKESLNESATSNLRDKIIDCLDWFILMEMEFPKDQFLADSWEDLKDGIEMGLDPEFETAEGIVEYLKPIISFNKHYTKEIEDEGVFQDEIDMYRSLIRAMNIYLKDQGYDDTVKE